LWISIPEGVTPVPSLKEYISKTTGLEANITEVVAAKCSNNLIAMAKDRNCGIILPATRMDLVYDFAKASAENNIELLFPSFDNCSEPEAETKVEAPCGIHYLKFGCLKKIAIIDGEVCFLDLDS
jgi:hypothetical protein